MPAPAASHRGGRSRRQWERLPVGETLTPASRARAIRGESGGRRGDFPGSVSANVSRRPRTRPPRRPRLAPAGRQRVRPRSFSGGAAGGRGQGTRGARAAEPPGSRGSCR